MAGSIVIFYEHFFDKGKHKIIAPSMKYFAYILIPILMVFFFLIFFNPTRLQIPYAYLTMGIVIWIIPLLTFFIAFPGHIQRILKTAPYFIYLGFLEEILGIQLGHWTFPGTEYVGWITLLHYQFPLEEFVFWIMTLAISVLAYFEFFDDEKLRKKE